MCCAPWSTQKRQRWQPESAALASQVDTTSAARSLLAWHPDGSVLAAPGGDHDVTVYERLSWEPAFALAGGHSAPVNAVCFSADGACQSSLLRPVAAATRLAKRPTWLALQACTLSLPGRTACSMSGT